MNPPAEAAEEAVLSWLFEVLKVDWKSGLTKVKIKITAITATINI